MELHTRSLFALRQQEFLAWQIAVIELCMWLRSQWDPAFLKTDSDTWKEHVDARTLQIMIVLGR